MRMNCDELASLASTSSSSAPTLAAGVTTSATSAVTSAIAPATRRKLRIFKEPATSSSSISQIIWTPKSSPPLSKTSTGSTSSSGASLPKLSNVSCASLPLSSSHDYVDGCRQPRQFSPNSAKSAHSLHDAPREKNSTKETGDNAEAPISVIEPLRMASRAIMSYDNAEPAVYFSMQNGVVINSQQEKMFNNNQISTNAKSFEDFVKLTNKKTENDMAKYTTESPYTTDSGAVASTRQRIIFTSRSTANLTRFDNNIVRVRRVSLGDETHDNVTPLRKFVYRLSDNDLNDCVEEYCYADFRSPTPKKITETLILADCLSIQIEDILRVSCPLVENKADDSSSVTSDSSSSSDEDEKHRTRRDTAELSLHASESSPQASSSPGATFFTESFNACGTIPVVATAAAALVSEIDARIARANDIERDETLSRMDTECSFDFGASLTTAIGDASTTSVSASTPAPFFKCIRRLRVGIVQLRGFFVDAPLIIGCQLDNLQLSASVKLDSDEVFQSTSVSAATNCTFGVETSCELPNDFHALHIILTLMCDGQRISWPMGRVTVTHRDLLDASDRYADAWLPITRVVGAPVTEILGDMCINMRFDTNERVLAIQVIDYTIRTSARCKTGRRDNNNNNNYGQHCGVSVAPHARQNSTVVPLLGGSSGALRRGGVSDATFIGVVDHLHHATESNARLYLRMCVSAGSAQYSPMKKLRVVERRGVKIARLDCAQLLAKKASTTSTVTTASASSSASGGVVGDTMPRRSMVSGTAPITSLKSLSPPPPRPPPPRLPPSYATKKDIIAATTSILSPILDRPIGFNAIEHDILLSRSGSGKGRLKARSRLLSSASGASISRSNISVFAVPAENPLRANVDTSTMPKLRRTARKKPKNADATGSDEDIGAAANTCHRPNGWQSTSSIPDNYIYCTADARRQRHPLQRRQKSPLKLRLNIKLYTDADYDEASYCGYVRIPLDETTMLPKGLPLGPNWFNIKSRSATTGVFTNETTAAHTASSHGATPKVGRRAAQSAPTAPSATPLCVSAFNDASASRNSGEATPETPRTARQRAGRRFVALLDTPPLHFRHSSTPFTSAAPENNSGAAITSGTNDAAGGASLKSLRGSTHSVIEPTSSNNAVIYHSTSSTARSTSSTSKPVVRNDDANSFTASSSTRVTTVATSAERIGEMRLRLRYSVDEILPLVHYQPLYTNLINSLSIKPYSASFTSILQYLPISVESIARPLMKIFVHANQIRAFLRLTCSQYVSSCQTDVNTLFRSHTLASKAMCELMNFVGQDYLIVTLKPLIDLIYAERKCCEIDPSKMRAGDSLDQNLRNLIVYAELAFSRVMDSRRRCPRVLREVFAELRATVAERFPGREDVARLAISSFLMLRFFSAAILHPKQFALRADAPEPDVSRTLVLVSKILQRLANCVVSAHPLFNKEEWLTPVMHRFLDDAHKREMTRFLDAVSSFSALNDAAVGSDVDESDDAELYDDVDGAPTNVAHGTDRLCCCDSAAVDIGAIVGSGFSGSSADTRLSLSCHEFGHHHRHRMPALLKHGHMIERRSGSDKKKSFKNFIHQKRRYVTLTETQLSWQKVSSGSVADLHHSLSLHHNRAAFGRAASTTTSTVTTRKNSDEKAPGSTTRHNSLHQTNQNQGQHKGQFVLAEITSVSPLSDAKNSFRVATPHSEVHFQASSPSEMNEWLILIQKQQRRHIMLLNRSSSEAPRFNGHVNSSGGKNAAHRSAQIVDEVDMEREMQIVHAHLLEHVDTLCQWRSILEREHAAILQQLQAGAAEKKFGDDTNGSVVSATSPTCANSVVALPLEKIFKSATTIGEREACLARLYETLVSTVAAIQQIEGAHQTARNLAFQMKVLRQQNNKNNDNNNLSSVRHNYHQQQQLLFSTENNDVLTKNAVSGDTTASLLSPTALSARKKVPSDGEKNSLGTLMRPASGRHVKKNASGNASVTTLPTTAL